MSDDAAFERATSDWLEAGIDRTPPEVLDAVLLAVRTTPQERDLRIPWRVTPMPTHLRLVAAVAIIAVAGVTGLTYLNGRPEQGAGVGATPSPTQVPTPSPSPTTEPSPTTNPLLDTSSWTTYVSDRYGFTIDYPSDWNPDAPSDHDWTFENDIEAWQSTATEHFLNPEGSVGVSAWSVAVDPGTTVESWIEAYCSGQSGGSCSGITDRAVPAETGDGHPGLGQFGPNADTMAFFLVGDRIYVAAVWRGETDPTVTRYGGAWRLLQAFVSTMTIGEPPQGSPDPS